MSKEYNTKDIMRKYRIQYKTELSMFYKDVENNLITLKTLSKQLFLKFIYVGKKVLIPKSYSKLTIF